MKNVKNKDGGSGHNSISSRLANGKLMQAATKQYLLSVNGAFDIDKIRWSIVKIGTQGKEHNDIYLDTFDMLRFVKEIDSGLALKKCQEDANSQYPSAYTWVTGKNGGNRMNIGGGKNGIRVQISSGDGFMNTLCSWADLEEFSFFFKLVSGYITFPEGTYWNSLNQLFWKGAAERHTEYDEDSDGRYISDNDTAPQTSGKSHRSQQNAQPQAQYQQSAQGYQSQPQQAQMQYQQNAQPQAQDIRRASFTAASGIMQRPDGNFEMNALCENNMYVLIIPAQVASALGETWGIIVQFASDLNNPMMFDAEFSPANDNGRVVLVLRNISA